MPLRAAAHRGRRGPRRADGVLRLHSADIDGDVVDAARGDLAPGGVDRLGRLPGRRGLGAARGRATPVAGADVADRLATCRPAPGCPPRRPWSARSLTALRRPVRARTCRGRSWPGSPSAPRTSTSARPTGIMDQIGLAAVPSGHALFLDSRDLPSEQVPFDLAAEGLACWSSTPGSRTRSATASTPSAGRLRAGGRGCSACPRCATSRPTAWTPPSPGSTTTSCGAGSGTWSPRTSGCWTRVALLRAGRIRGDRPGPDRPGTPRCATTSRSPAPSWTSGSRRPLAAGALGARMTGGGFGGSVLALVAGATERRGPRPRSPTRTPGAASASLDSSPRCRRTAPAELGDGGGPGTREPPPSRGEA